MGVTGKRVEKSGIGDGARTMAGAGSTDLLYGSRGVPAAHRHPGSFRPHEPCPSGPQVTIFEAPEERRHSERRVGTDVEDIATFYEGSRGKRCHLRVPAEESDEVTSCSSGSRTRRYGKGGSPKPSKGDAGTAMEMVPSPVRRMFSALSDSEGYHTCYCSDDAGAEPDFPGGRSHTAPNPELAHVAERESLPRRAATTIVPRHTGDGEEGRMDGDGTGDTVMGGGKERGALGKLPQDREADDHHPHKDIKKAACGQAGSGDHCHCHHVDFLIGSYPQVGKDALIQKIDKSDDTTSRILEDQAIFDNDLKTIRLHGEDYQAKLESMLVQQQRVVDDMIKYLEIVENRMRELEKRGGIPTPVPGLGPDLPWDPAPESLLRRVTTLRTVAERVAPMEGPMESAPYGTPRVDPSLLRHIPLFSASVMLGEQTPEKGSGIGTPKWDAREETVEINMSSPPAAATFDARAAHAARVDEEASRSAARRDSSSGGAEDPWVMDPRSGIWTMGGPSVGEAVSQPREDMEIRGVYSQSPGNGSSGGIRLGGVIASDVGDAVRLQDLRGVKIPYYDANPANLDDFILDWEDFAEELVGEMRQDARDKWLCRTFPHRLASELKADLGDQIREKRISTEEQCLDWLEQEERVDSPHQKLDDLRSIPLNSERGELRLRDWGRYLRKSRRLPNQVEDWSESSKIRHLLRDVLPSYWKKRVEDEEKKRAKKRLAVRIMSPEDQHRRIIKYFRGNLGEPDRMISMKNLVYVEVFGDTAGGRLLRLNNVQWRRGEKLRMQMIPASMSLDSIIQYVSVELKLNSENEAHIKDRHGNENRGRRDHRNYRAIQEDPTVGGDRSEDPGSEDENTSSGGEYMTWEDHEDAHFFAFVAQNRKAYGHDKGKWRKAPARQGKEPRRIGNPPLSFTEYRREHGGCWFCYGKG